MIGKLLIGLLMFILFVMFVVFSATDNSKDKSIRVILNFGVFLILTSSVIFITSTWESLSNNFKQVFLIIETFIFLLFGFLLRYLFKIKNTGNSLILIGNLLLNVTYIFIGVLNLFNTTFITSGNVYLFFALLAVIDLIISAVLMIINKNDNYIYVLLSIIPIPFLISMYFSKNVQFSLLVVSIFMFILNLLKKFLSKKTIFNIVNIVLITILSIVLLSSNVLYLYDPTEILFGRINIIVFLISIIGNVSLYLIYQNNSAINIFSLLYCFITISISSMFSRSMIYSSLLLVIGSIYLYIIYALSKDKVRYITSNVLSNILAFASMIVACFSVKYIIIAPFICLVFIIINIINSLNLKRIKILDIIFRIFYILMFIISIIVQPAILKVITASMVFIFILYSLLITYVVATIRKLDTKLIYKVIFMITLFVGMIWSTQVSAVYSLLIAIVYVITYLFMHFVKDENDKVIKFFVYLMLLILTLNSFGKYHFIATIVLLIINILFIVITKNKEKYAYTMLCYIPIVSMLSSAPINYTTEINEMMAFLKMIFFLVPLSIFFRKIISVPNIVSTIAEIFTIVIIYIPFMFMSNIYVTITLGIISVILFVLGYVCNREPIVYTGFILTVLVVIINTFKLWSSLPWWVYMLIVGIILVIVALVKEIRKK